RHLRQGSQPRQRARRHPLLPAGKLHRRQRLRAAAERRGRTTANRLAAGTGDPGTTGSPMMNRQSRGFSLIEMLVAMVILGLTLGVLYQASAGATRNVRLDVRYTYAVQIAQSLLADYPRMPPGGVNRSGTSG